MGRARRAHPASVVSGTFGARDGAIACANFRLTAPDRPRLLQMQDELAVDGLLLGVARAEAYAETERLIAERRARGLFGDLRFTLTNTPRSCHPERLVRGARSVI